MQRSLLCKSTPDSPFSQAIGGISQRILSEHFGAVLPPIENYEDLAVLADQAAEWLP